MARYKEICLVLILVLIMACSPTSVPSVVDATDTVLPRVTASASVLPSMTEVSPTITSTLTPTLLPTDTPTLPPTDTPTATATILPTSTSTIAATPTIPPPTFTAVPTSNPASLVITSVTSPVKAGDTAALSALTSSGASCTITVYYKSGPSKASGLGPKVADASGNVSWSWKVGSSTSAGTWRIVLNCSSEGTNLTQETTFTVKK